MKLSVMKVFSKKSDKINKYKDRIGERVRIDEENEIIRVKNYNFDHNDVITWGERFDKEILTDKEKREKSVVKLIIFPKEYGKLLFLFCLL